MSAQIDCNEQLEQVDVKNINVNQNINYLDFADFQFVDHDFAHRYTNDSRVNDSVNRDNRSELPNDDTNSNRLPSDTSHQIDISSINRENIDDILDKIISNRNKQVDSLPPDRDCEIIRDSLPPDRDCLYDDSDDSIDSVVSVQAANRDSLPIKHETRVTRSISIDPGTWPRSISTSLRAKLITKGPIQIDHVSFPRDANNRGFSIVNYSRRLANGERERRDWLVYSRVRDAAFCFPCRLFASESRSPFASVGCRNWAEISNRLVFHEASLKHRTSVERWNESLKMVCGEAGRGTRGRSSAAECGSRVASQRTLDLYFMSKQIELKMEKMTDEEDEGKK